MNREKRYADNLRRQDAAVADVAAGRMTLEEAAKAHRVPVKVLRIIMGRTRHGGI